MHLCNRCLGIIPNYLPDKRICGRCEEEDRLKTRLTEAGMLLKKIRQGYLNLVEVKALPHEEWDEVARAIAEEIDAFLQNSEPEKPDENCLENWSEEGEEGEHDD